MTRTKTIRLTVILAVLALLCGLFVAMYLWEKSRSDFSSSSRFEMADLVEHKGTLYRLRSDVDTLLVIGVDQFSETVEDGSYNNNQCADFLLLFIMDHTAKRCSVIQINRDTVTDVTVLGIGGKKTGVVCQQITLSHTYGTGEQDSCRNTARAISGLFGGLSVDRFICLTMDAVGIINDSVGGVRLTMTEDLTAIDPAFREGESVLLTSQQALSYVRQRSAWADSSNTARMKRQEQYLSALYAEFLSYVEENDGVPFDLMAKLSPYMHSDYSASELERAWERLSAYERGEFLRQAGSYSTGEYMEFHLDEDALKEQILDCFYEKVL